jgi:hypothetical protein
VTQPPFQPAGTPPATDHVPAGPVPPLAGPARLDRGLAVTAGLNGSTTYHQQAPATASDVTAGDKVRVSGGFRPGRVTDGSIDLGTAGDITIVS